MTLPDPPDGDCPVCGSHDWEWAEWSIWVGYQCAECDTGVILGT